VADTEIAEDLRISDLKIKPGSGPENHSTRPGFHLIGTKIKTLRLADIAVSGKLDLKDDEIGTLDVADYVPPNAGQNQCRLQI